jgi:NAD(P)-dependent dehydrogenase (short-subunit alcohol dehydrogenase family)
VSALPVPAEPGGGIEREAVIITGASTGIGAATALRLARRGLLVFAGVRREADGAALAREGGANLRPLMLDVSDAASIESARVEFAMQPGVVLRALINNAGIGLAGPLELLPLADIRRQIEVNLIGPLAVTKAFLPQLRATRGRLINVTSIGGKFASPFGGAYAASKFALEAASDALRVELAPFGIRVIVIEPGAIKTQFWGSGQAAGNALLATIAPGLIAPYQVALERFRAFVLAAADEALPPERVAAVIERSLFARNPRARYVVGNDARLQLLLARLPEPLRDAIVRRSLGLSAG